MAVNQLELASRTKTINQTEKFGISAYISEENNNRLQSIMYTKLAAAGSYLFWDGDETEYLYYVRSGIIKLVKSTEEGRDMTMSIVQKGDLIMEMNGFHVSLHNFSAIVIEDAEVGVIQKKDLEILLQRHGDFALEFMSWMGLMHRITQSKFRDLLMYGKPGALASTLIRMCNSFGIACEDGIRIDLKLTNTELAEIIGATRESVNRMLSELKTEGTITVKNGQIIVQRLSNLKGKCNCPSFLVCPLEICRM
ncbi:MAG: Crp/Fnr family transcriptional regulator [Paenibacillaceae bacterium]